MKIKYKIVLVRQEYQSLRMIKTITLKEIKSTIKYGNSTLSINVTQPTYIHNDKIFYFMNLEQNKQLFFLDKQSPLNSEELDMLISNDFIKKITSGAMDSTKDKIINMIIGAIMGGMVAAFVAMLYMNSQIQSIYDSFLEPTLGVVV